MNYLAHLLLAEPSSESLIGNLLGDFVKGPLKELEACYSAGIVGGIAMHRQVDVFTDTHVNPNRITNGQNHHNPNHYQPR